MRMETEIAVREPHVSSMVVDEIIKLKTREGLIRPKDVVDYARDEASPLHKYFIWDDTEAAERFRIAQASILIRASVTYLPQNHEKTLVRAFVSLRDDRRPDGGYRHIIDVINDEDLKTKLVEDALYELTIFQKKYERKKELKPIFKGIEEVRKKTKKKKNK